MFKRELNLESLIKKNSFFFFGPRATGKSSLIKESFKKNTQIIDLLDADLYEELLRRPKALAEKIKSDTQLVVIDEVQKLPKLLDEVHRQIAADSKIRFLLTGSSTRKLKRDGANLLAGRAWEAHLFPLVSSEIPDFDLHRYLNFGGLPRSYLAAQPAEELKAYCRTYLTEEVKHEALVRNYERFVKFLDTMALSNTLELNYQTLAQDAGVPPRTLEGYIEVLKDTLLAFELLPYQKTVKRKATTKSKFYFFDTGVANYLAQRLPIQENSVHFGEAFEQFIINEVRAYISYRRKDHRLTYWRSKTFEVDLIVGQTIAIEIKSAKQMHKEDTKGLVALKEEQQIKNYLLINRCGTEGKTAEGVDYMDYKIFLKKLWNDELIL